MGVRKYSTRRHYVLGAKAEEKAEDKAEAGLVNGIRATTTELSQLHCLLFSLDCGMSARFIPR